MKRYILNLQLFAEEGGAAPSADTGALASSTAETSGGIDTAGEQAAPAEESFDDLIKGKYKEDYSKRVQEAVNKRFRNQKDFKETIDRMNPLLEMLGQRYGVAAKEDGSIDYDSLSQKIADDNSMYEDEAFQRGMSVEDLKHMKQLERENQRLTRQAKESEEDRKSREEFDRLYKQGEEVKKLYPNFDLREAMADPNIARLVFHNVPLQTAYEVAHKDEIMRSGMQYAVQQTEKKISNAIQSGSRRPTESGASSGAPSSGTLDPSKLTLKDFENIRLQAQRGNKITFS